MNNDGAYKIKFDGFNFTIIDEYGIKYFFDGNKAEKVRPYIIGSTYYNPNNTSLTYCDFDFFNTYANYHNYTGCSSEMAFGLSFGASVKIKWNLTKIESPDGKHAIDFTYDDFAYYQYGVNFVYNIDKATNQQYHYYHQDSGCQLLPKIMGLMYKRHIIPIIQND